MQLGQLITFNSLLELSLLSQEEVIASEKFRIPFQLPFGIISVITLPLVRMSGFMKISFNSLLELSLLSHKPDGANPRLAKIFQLPFGIISVITHI